LFFTLQRSLQIALVGLFCTLNFVSLLSLAERVPSLLSETSGQTVTHPYDWKIGVFQFCLGFPVAFMGLISMQGSALSILSKLSPSKFRSVTLHVGTLSVFVGCIARLTGDIQLFFVGLSHRLINTDIINASKCHVSHDQILTSYYLTQPISPLRISRNPFDACRNSNFADPETLFFLHDVRDAAPGGGSSSKTGILERLSKSD
jgi:hypothetical protein